MLFGLLLLVCGYALRVRTACFGGVLFQRHQRNVSPAKLLLSELSLLRFVHVSIFGAVSTATVPKRAAVRNHDKMVRFITEPDFGFLVVTDFGASCLMNHVAANPD